MKEIYAEIEVSKAWWDNESDLAKTFIERAYEANGPHGNEVMILRFGPFTLFGRGKSMWENRLTELEALMDFIVGEHILRYKLTSKPF